MSLELFAGLPVRDFRAARAWYSAVLGAEPSFLPHETEAVWEVGPHAYVYVVQRPAAGGGLVTLMVDDLDARVAGAADRGLQPVLEETYGDGVRKTTYRDLDGNEIAFGALPG